MLIRRWLKFSRREELYAILYTAPKHVLDVFYIYLPTKIAKIVNSLSNDQARAHYFKKKYY